MLRIIVCVLVAACGGGIGFQICRRYQSRVRQLEKCGIFLAGLWTRLLSERFSTRELLEQAATNPNLAELAFLGETVRELQIDPNFPRIWKESLTRCQKGLALAQEDYPPLFSLAEILGAYEAEAQVEAIKIAEALLKQNYEQAREESRMHGKLSCSLGLFGGLALAVLLI